MATHTEDNPHWVEASSVRFSSDPRFVDVTVNGVLYKHKRKDWNDPLMNKTKADALVQESDGNWVRAWFYEKDILPYVAPTDSL